MMNDHETDMVRAEVLRLAWREIVNAGTRDEAALRIADMLEVVEERTRGRELAACTRRARA